MPKMCVYLAGPMRGLPQFNFPEFMRVADKLRKAELTVFNPAEQDENDGHDFSERTGHEDLADIGFNLRRALSDDLEFITGFAEGVACLPGWETSLGATAEVCTALALGLHVFEWDTAWDDDRPTTEWMFPDNRPSPVLSPEAAAYVLAALDFDSDPSTESWKESLGEVRVTSTTGGQKGSKPQRYDLIPAGPLALLAELYGRGASKYEDRNWERGYDWSLSFAALNRHLWAFWNGEDLDAETGLPHITSVAWHALALSQFMQQHPEFDNRPTTDKDSL